VSVAGSCETPPCDYCWLGTPTENNCPTAWNGTGDGCDCGCQFIDPDCSGCAPECDYCWLGTPYEKNCSLDWLDDGECDCGCQFTDVLDCCREACDDGSACTTDSCEISNGVPEGYVCTHILLPGYCLIGGHCYADGQRQVFEPCQTCDSAEQPNDWTPLPKGSSCDALINGDSCGPRCDYCWLGTPYENNCSVQWLDDGDCDCTASSSILIVAPNASSTACVTSSARASWSRTTRYATMMRSATAPKRAIRSTAAKVVRR